jgi:hypothetical protein
LVREFPALARTRAQARLRKILGLANDRDFCLLVAATDLLQSGHVDIAAKYISYPSEAASVDITSEFRVHPWFLETLINELLATPKKAKSKSGKYRTLNCTSFSALSEALNSLAKLENLEYAVRSKSKDIHFEMHRIAQRQFHWQRGFANISKFYRSAFLYNTEQTNLLFEAKHEFSISDLMLCGLIFWAFFNEEPIMKNDISLTSLGINDRTRTKVLNLLSIGHRDAREKALQNKSMGLLTAYSHSVLREKPILNFGEDNIAPLRELIVNRITSGIFYDVIGLSGSTRTSVGQRFEIYCGEIFKGYLPEITVSVQFAYDKGQKNTPDLLLSAGEELFAVVECKATRMNFETKFSDAAASLLGRGYNEILKAVFQIWKFFAHCRQNRIIAPRSITKRSVGVVLTLDGWLEMFSTMQNTILSECVEFARSKDKSIIDEDMRPIVFTQIDDLEFTLKNATTGGFIDTIIAASTPRYTGYHLSSVQKETQKDKIEQTKYPLAERINEVLPWWPVEK